MFVVRCLFANKPAADMSLMAATKPFFLAPVTSQKERHAKPAVVNLAACGKISENEQKHPSHGKAKRKVVYEKKGPLNHHM
jgi:hypothetical protein